MSEKDFEQIDLYLAGRLDEAGQERVETRIVAEPAFRREVELTVDLKTGLRRLQQSGELPDLMQDGPPRFRERPVFALAASVAAGALGVATLALYNQLQHARDAAIALQRGHAGHELAPARRTAVLTLARTRSAGGPDLVWKQAASAQLVELRLDPGLSPAPVYRVQLERIDGATRSTILSAPSLAPTPSGELVLSVHSMLLQPGDYAVEIEPVAGDAAHYEYSLRVER